MVYIIQTHQKNSSTALVLGVHVSFPKYFKLMYAIKYFNIQFKNGLLWKWRSYTINTNSNKYSIIRSGERWVLLPYHLLYYTCIVQTQITSMSTQTTIQYNTITMASQILTMSFSISTLLITVIPLISYPSHHELW